MLSSFNVVWPLHYENFCSSSQTETQCSSTNSPSPLPSDSENLEWVFWLDACDSSRSLIQMEWHSNCHCTTGSVTLHDVFKSHPRCGQYQNFLPVSGWVIVHSTYCHNFLLPSFLDGHLGFPALWLSGKACCEHGWALFFFDKCGCGIQLGTCR